MSSCFTIICASMAVYVTSPEAVWSLRPRGKPPPCSPDGPTSARHWCHLNLGTQCGSFVQRQAGGLFHAGAAVLAVVFINNTWRHPPPARSRKFQFQCRFRHRVACLNVRSLNKKLEDVLEIVRDRTVDIFCVTESWHDAESACLGRLRSAGYNVVDRPRLAVDDLSVNHGNQQNNTDGISLYVRVPMRWDWERLQAERCRSGSELERSTLSQRRLSLSVLADPASHTHLQDLNYTFHFGKNNPAKYTSTDYYFCCHTLSEWSPVAAQPDHWSTSTSM